MFLFSPSLKTRIKLTTSPLLRSGAPIYAEETQTNAEFILRLSASSQRFQRVNAQH